MKLIHVLLNIWWHHDMEMLSTLLALCEGNPPVIGGFPSQGPVMQTFDVSFAVSWTWCWTNIWIDKDLRWHDTHVNSLSCIVSSKTKVHNYVLYVLWFCLTGHKLNAAIFLFITEAPHERNVPSIISPSTNRKPFKRSSNATQKLYTW